MESLKNGAPMTEEVINTNPETDEVTVEQVVDQEVAHSSLEDAGC